MAFHSRFNRAGNGCEWRKGKRRIPWIPACVGMTAKVKTTLIEVSSITSTLKASWDNEGGPPQSRLDTRPNNQPARHPDTKKKGNAIFPSGSSTSNSFVTSNNTQAIQ